MFVSLQVKPKLHNRKELIWPIVAITLAALIAVDPFYEPHIPLKVGIAAWFADVALVLILSTHRITARIGIIAAGLFFVVPCFLWASPLSRLLLMCFMSVPFAGSLVPLFGGSTANLRTRLAYFFSWMGTQTVERRGSSFDIFSLLRLITAAAVFATALACEKMVPSGGLWLAARWLAGGVMIFAFAEVATAGHDLITRLMGLSAPALMRSPFLSTSVGEFWTRRWNVAASVLVFDPLIFVPLARRGGIVLALFGTFFASAVGHVLLFYMATGQWMLALVCGAFFVVQPLLILAERRMKVRQWPTTKARVWTLTMLAVSCPLVVEPALRIVTPSLGADGGVLLPTAAVLGFAIVVNGFFSVGQLVFSPKVRVA